MNLELDYILNDDLLFPLLHVARSNGMNLQVRYSKHKSKETKIKRKGVAF